MSLTISRQSHLQTCLFADDCIMYGPLYEQSDCVVIQQDLDGLAEWESKSCMEFYPQKCSVLSVSRSRDHQTPSYKLIGHILSTEDATKYLGVDLQATVSWKTHIERIFKKPNSMPRILRRSCRSCSEDLKANTYFSIVRLNLEYCSLVLTQHKKCQIRKLEINQRTAAWYTKNRYRNTSSLPSILEHLQWESLDSRRSKIQLIQTDSIVCPNLCTREYAGLFVLLLLLWLLCSGFGCIFLYPL